MTVHGNDQKFMRPIDVTATRRNRHRIRATRILVFLTNLLLVTTLVAGGYWLLRRIHEDERFAIRTIEIVGLDEARRQEAMRLVDHWQGANLFRLEMGEVRHDLARVEWIDDVTVEKMLPDRMRIEIVERVPQALVSDGSRLRYIDDEGVAFGEAAEAEMMKYPVIEQASGRAARSCVAFLEKLESDDPALHSRVERIRPAGTSGWELFDRDLRTVVRIGENDATMKWRALYGIVAAERFTMSAVTYADLRFDDQIVIGRGEKVVQE